MEKNYVISFDEFLDWITDSAQLKAEEEFKNFCAEPFNPEEYDIEDYVTTITFEVVKDLILFLEEKGCKQFEIRYPDGKVVYYEPVEYEEKDTQELWNIVGKDIFDNWGDWLYDNMMEEYYRED